MSKNGSRICQCPLECSSEASQNLSSDKSQSSFNLRGIRHACLAHVSHAPAFGVAYDQALGDILHKSAGEGLMIGPPVMLIQKTQLRQVNGNQSVFKPVQLSEANLSKLSDSLIMDVTTYDDSTDCDSQF